jgi:LCP family protein required for cell wall assembly
MWKRFVAGMVSIFVLTATGSATAVLLEIDRLDRVVSEAAPPPLDVPELDIDPGGPQTLLLLGSDRRFEDRRRGRPSRSDTMILVRLDPDAGATTILSLPRDLRTEFAGGRVDKLNYAYEAAGPRGVVRAVKRLMGPGFPVNHVVNVNFGAFTRGVKRLGCFYIDVDRRYFNDNDPPTASAERYAEIDLQPGYQRMCGLDSLDFVRFRHLDTDFVRSARQQHYLGLAKDQVDFRRLFADRDELLRIFATYTDTDVKDLRARLRLLRLAAEAAQQPLRRIELDGDISEDLAYVNVPDAEVERARREFLDPPAVRETPAPRRRTGTGTARRRSPSRALAPSLVPAPAIADADAGFPVAVPRRMVEGSRPWNGHSSAEPRAYAIVDRGGRRHRAHRITMDAGPAGRFYGIQSTTWPHPPILRGPSATQSRRGKRLMLFRDGRRLRVVAWREGGAVHWVANTLERTLTNREMLGIAETAALRR